LESSTIPTTDRPELRQEYSRKATGLVREVGLVDMIQYCAANTTPLGLAVLFGLFTLVLFPQSNYYIAFAAILVCGLFVWTMVSLLTAAMPKIGGDYTINSRILTPWLGLGGNVGSVISAAISSGIWAWWAATLGLSPMFTVIGKVLPSQTFTDWGATFANDGNHQWQTFLAAVVVLLITSGLAVLGTRVVVRAMTILFGIATVGFVVSMGILLFTSHAHFVHTIDATSGPHAYADTVAKGASQGIYPTDGYSLKNTIGGIYYVAPVALFVFTGFFLAPEFKRAGQRKRMLQVMWGSGFGQGLLVMLGTFIFLNTVGYDFFVSALNGNFAEGDLVGTAGYAYFAALVAKSSLVVVFLALTFLGWFLPAQYINAVIVQRCLFAWSFDGLAPRKLSTVSERFHTPTVAILVTLLLSMLTAAWVAFSDNFFTVYSTMILFAFVPLTLLGVSAAVVARRRPDLYRGTPAEWRWRGIPILPITGVVSAFIGAGAIVLALVFHENIGLTTDPAVFGISYYHLAMIAPFFALAVGAVWYYSALAYRRRQGIDLSLNYQSIPPE
jgi:basic amino acid/polyamine antiporter, APA family